MRCGSVSTPIAATSCYGCPYTDERGIPRDNCMNQLMADAAKTIDALQCESK